MLIRAELWGKKAETAAGLALTAADWRAVVSLAGEQTVTGLAFGGLQRLNPASAPPDDLLMGWAVAADAIERRNKQMNAAVEAITAAFRRKGLSPVVQKGQGAARHYEEPLLRECGDIDLYFAGKDDWDKALCLLRHKGIDFADQPDGAVAYRLMGFEVEHHRRLLDLYNPFKQKTAEKVVSMEGFSRIWLSENEGAGIDVPRPITELLLQYLHILKHALGHGIGLRQLCDMARACHSLRGSFDTQKLEMLCLRLGIDRWCRLLHRFLVDRLGLDVGSLPYPTLAPSAQRLESIVWRGGNFGFHDPALGKGATRAKRKLQTATAYGRNLAFGLRCAPGETFWLIAQLTRGQMR